MCESDYENNLIKLELALEFTQLMSFFSFTFRFLWIFPNISVFFKIYIYSVFIIFLHLFICLYDMFALKYMSCCWNINMNIMTLKSSSVPLCRLFMLEKSSLNCKMGHVREEILDTADVFHLGVTGYNCAPVVKLINMNSHTQTHTYTHESWV